MRNVALGLSALFAAGCSMTIEDGDHESTAVTRQAVQIGIAAQSSETVITTPVASQLVMTFNSDDPGLITYNNNSRQVFSQASMMGFVLQNVATRQRVAAGRPRPPNGWSVFWGDPAITRARTDSTRIFISNVAVPRDKFPSSGRIEGPINPGGLPANFCGAYLGGACIARSTNGGNSFSAAAQDCVRRTTASCPFGTFYDGGDMETDTSGRVYAAFFDISRGRLDVYMATGLLSSFARVTDPPPMFGHPRIKAGPGGLYLVGSISTVSGTGLAISRYGGGSSFTGTWTTPTLITSSADVFNSVNGIRLSADSQRDIDIGPNEEGVVEARVAYTFTSGGRMRVGATLCTTGATITCSTPFTWQTTTAGHQFHPAIATTGSRVWNLTFMNTNGSASQVEVWKAVFSRIAGTARFVAARQEAAQTPCPDNRGYWGDYDNMVTDAGGGNFYRGYSDSTTSACSRANFTSTPLNAFLTFYNQSSIP